MAEWAGVVASTIAKYFRGAEPAVLRNRKVLAMLADRGLISYNNSGEHVEWRTRYLQNAMSGFGDGNTLTFPRINRLKVMSLDWRGYSCAEQMFERDKAMNKGTEAIVKVFSEMAGWMHEDVDEQLGTEVYVDGNASGNGQKFHGIESFMGVTGTVSSSKVGAPSSTYAGVSCALGAFGGVNVGNWPDGTAPTNYDFWSPVVVDYTNANWPQAVKTWENTCIDAQRYGLMASRRNKGKNKQIDVVIHERELYRKLVTLYQTEERINVRMGPEGGSSGLLKLGFSDIINFDGVDTTWEYGVPDGVGYGWCMNDVELMSLYEELLKVKGPVFAEEAQAWRIWLIILANLKFKSLRNFVAWKAVT